ncbi:alpha/beta fold hydrolase [Agaribacterium haliotis]|uniref:alpha/beta fold hydrolase n=1 Tax=Agaribacterium haliotis TaxID=2013869 RepID=UPI000BB58A1E|nr:alpha/beta fold hydrolase [Agaribacterium haliotis]
MHSSAREVRFELDSVSLAGLRWHEGSPIKVLALHGWLDNAASFAQLAPQLPECDVLALDLAGQGLSTHRPGKGAYNIWQDLRELIQVLQQLAWPRAVLLGHSRGAMVLSLFAACFPERTLGLVLLDALLPHTTDEVALPRHLRTAVMASLDLKKLRRRSYHKSFEAAVHSRMQGLYPLSYEASELLAQRSVRRDADKGWYWHFDSALMLPSELRLSPAQARAFLDAWQQRALLVAASDGFLVGEALDKWREHEKLMVVELDGGHHLHMSAKHEQLGPLVNTIKQYLVTLDND